MKEEKGLEHFFFFRGLDPVDSPASGKLEVLAKVLIVGTVKPCPFVIQDRPSEVAKPEPGVPRIIKEPSVTHITIPDDFECSGVSIMSDDYHRVVLQV